MITGRLRQLAVVLSAGAMLATNLLLGGGGGGLDDEGSRGMYDAFPTAFSPAPLTFAVWGPIFLGAVVLAIYQALPSLRHDRTLDRLGLPLVASYLLNAATPFTPIGVSNVVILALFVTLCAAYWIASRDGDLSLARTWAVRVPISLLTTWIGLATVLNSAQLAVSCGVAVGPLKAAVLIALAGAAGAVVIVRFSDLAVASVVGWALYGIVIARPGAHPVPVAATISGTVIAIAAAYAAHAMIVNRLWVRKGA